jgi:hypothetical protein
MPEIKGTDSVKLIPPRLRLFYYCYSEYALGGIEPNAIDYLLKTTVFSAFASCSKKLKRTTSN